MLIADSLYQTKVEIKPGVWVVARPVPGTFKMRLHDAIQVLKGKADAVKFIGQ